MRAIMTDDDEILATIHASAGRRWMGVLSLYGLAGLLAYVAFAEPPALGWLLFTLVLAAASLWLADAMRRATTRGLELTRTELRDTDGQVLAPLSEIQSVDRGFFAFKPSNGFLIRTARKTGPRTWHPGVWWRMGRTIGVGGVTAASQSKFASEMISALLAERELQDNDQ